MAPQVIAKEDLIVHDPHLDIDRKLVAGQPVPPDLVEVYEEKVNGGSATSRSRRTTPGKPDAVVGE